ncbi:MAG: hypothetical protein EBT21_03420 [Actinobacteria bacterium]|nr:hypothetical protein [Actinomycetota bacterium]
MPPEEVARFSDIVREVRKGRHNLVEHLAQPVSDELERVSNVGTCSNPLLLLALADVAGDDHLIARQRFEALSIIDLAIMTRELERHDPMLRVEHDQTAMIELLEKLMFSGSTTPLTVYTYHDAERRSVRHVSYGTSDPQNGTSERVHHNICRVLSRDGVVARLDGEPKERFSTVLMLLRQMWENDGRDPYRMTDRCRFKFAVKDVDAVRTLSDELYRVLVSSGASVKDDGDNLLPESAATATKRNQSKKYRKKQLVVTWNGRVYEFQIVLFQDYYGAKFALDDENHRVYKLRQGIECLLPLLYPGSLYLKEGTWEDPSLKRLLHDHIILTLDWNHERYARNGKH